MKKHYLAYSLSLCLTACAFGGGSFDVQETTNSEASAAKPTITTNKPKTTTVETKKETQDTKETKKSTSVEDKTEDKTVKTEVILSTTPIDTKNIDTGDVIVSDQTESKVVEPEVILENKTKVISYKRIDPPASGDFTELGYVIDGSLPKTDERKLYKLDAEKSYRYLEEDGLGTVKVKYYDSANKIWKIREVSLDPATYVSDAKKQFPNKQYDGIDTSGKAKLAYVGVDGENLVLKVYNNEHTVIGIARIKDPDLINVIFYKGTNKTLDLPISGTATYTGHWEFAHQLHSADTRNSNLGGSQGEFFGKDKAVSFTVDFDSKKLTGRLNDRQDNAVIDYNISADINGNSFTGTATGTYDFKGQNGEGSSDANVSGSFYGPKAEELAGKVVATDQSWASVFAAKREGEVTTAGDAYQAGVIKFNDDGTLTQYTKVNYSGDVTKLQVDGKIIDLNTEDQKVCCTETQAVKFGTYQYTTDNNLKGGYTIQGVTTTPTEIPQQGKTTYSGGWQGYAQDNARVIVKEAKAKFVADWDKKELDGKLFAEGQDVESVAPINFTASIDKNTFSGTATIKGLNSDNSKDNLNSAVINGEANVQGHFYGKSANELGGHLIKDDQSIGGVFGGKETE